MKIVAMSEEMGQRKLQALVSEATAERFQEMCKQYIVTQEKALGFLAELFVRLPEPLQGTLSLSLRNDAAFLAFMQAVDSVVRDTILSRLPSVQGLLGVEALGEQVAAAEEKSQSERRRRGPRGAKD